MESEWRMNVWRIGLTNFGIELAAQQDVNPSVYFCKVRGVPDNAYVVVYPAGGYQPWLFVGYVGRHDDVPHFRGDGLLCRTTPVTHTAPGIPPGQWHGCRTAYRPYITRGFHYYPGRKPGSRGILTASSPFLHPPGGPSASRQWARTPLLPSPPVRQRSKVPPPTRRTRRPCPAACL